jgi:hypothetical protein
MTALSGHRRFGDGVVVTAVLADRTGECPAVQVLLAEENLRAAERSLRAAGYKKAHLRGRAMNIDDDDATLAVAHYGQILERPWLDRGPWEAARAV